MRSLQVQPRRIRLAAIGRLALWLAGVLFVVQMLAATQHHHDLSAQGADCVSCVLNAQLPSTPPEPGLQETAFHPALLKYYIVHAPAIAAPHEADHLIPPSHGPPASHS